MRRTISFLVTLLILLVAADKAWASVWVNTSASPNPFPSGATVYIDVWASWSEQHYECAWGCQPEYVEVEITGTNGFVDWYSTPLWGATSGFYQFSDSGPGQSMSSVWYDITVRVWYRDFEYNTWYSEDGSHQAYAEPAPPPQPPTITGPDTVWWFGGLTVAGYDTSITLSADSGPNTTWEIVAGGQWATLSVSSGQSTVLTPTNYSGSLGEIRVRATRDGVSSDEFAVTARTPFLLASLGNSTECSLVYGYSTVIRYRIKDQFGANLPAGIGANEKWGSAPVKDWPTTNWRQGEETGAFLPEAAFEDNVEGEHYLLPPNPQPGCQGNDIRVIHWEQEWRIGSETIGVGRLVQVNRLQLRLDFAAHENIR